MGGVGHESNPHASLTMDNVNQQFGEVLKMMEWIPIVLVTFKVVVFGTGMFFAIKWHYDREKEEKKKEMTGAVLPPQSSGVCAPAADTPPARR